MTTPEPRVRVTWDVWRPAAPRWIFRCPWCFAGIYRYTQYAAYADAIEHVTEEPCDGMRLALLVRELEALRDQWRVKGDDGYFNAAAGLAAILGRMG